MITPEQAVVYSILICIGGAVATLLLSQSRSLSGWLCFLATSATAVLIFTACAGVLTGGPSPHPASFWTMPGTGYELRFYVDGLSAIFLGLVAVMAVPAALYSINYVKTFRTDFSSNLLMQYSRLWELNKTFYIALEKYLVPSNMKW